MNLEYLLKGLKRYLSSPWTSAEDVSNEEVRQELGFHLMSSAEDLHESGMSIEDAQSEAYHKFGDLKKVLRECGEIGSSGQQLWHRVHLFITAGLVVCVATLFTAQLQTNLAPPEKRLSMATGFSFEETHGDVFGNVSDPAGEAISNANVIAVVKTWPEGGYRQQSYMTTTGVDGSFRIDNVYSPDHNYEVQVSVVAEGRLLTSRYIEMASGILDRFAFKLRPTNLFEIRFEDEKGEPLEHVAAFPSARTDQAGNRHQVYFMGSAPIVLQSDERGTIPITQFTQGERVEITVRFPNEEDWQVRNFIVPDDNRVVVMNPTAL